MWTRADTCTGLLCVSCADLHSGKPAGKKKGGKKGKKEGGGKKASGEKKAKGEKAGGTKGKKSKDPTVSLAADSLCGGGTRRQACVCHVDHIVAASATACASRVICHVCSAEVEGQLSPGKALHAGRGR